MGETAMNKELKRYLKDIKNNLPCCNTAMRKMLDDLKTSVNVYINENDITQIDEIERHFGTAEDIAKEFAVGLDNAYIKSYKFKKRVTAIVLSVLAAILVIVAALAIYIVIDNEKNTPVKYEPTVKYEYSEDYVQ